MLYIDRVPAGQHSAEYAVLEIVRQPTLWIVIAVTASYILASTNPSTGKRGDNIIPSLFTLFL